MKTVLITGGTGLVGKAITRLLLKEGYDVIILTRDIKKSTANSAFANQVSYAAWDVEKQTLDTAALQKADYIIHLAGAGVVDKKWTKTYKKEIIDSRVESGKLLVKKLNETMHKVTTLVSASAIGIYGKDNGKNLPKGFTETDAADSSFLGETCRLWEESVAPVTAAGVRLVVLRLGIVLSAKGGALAEFQKPIKLGVAGILGSGKQIVSWIHISDLCNVFLLALQNDKLQGTYNAVAPHPVSNEVLTKTLAREMKGNLFIPMHVPEFVLKIMMGERSIEVLKSATVSADKIAATTFNFKYPTIEVAVKELVK